MYGIMINRDEGWRRFMETYTESGTKKTRPYETDSLEDLADKYDELLSNYPKKNLLPIQDLTVELNVNIKDELGI